MHVKYISAKFCLGCRNSLISLLSIFLIFKPVALVVAGSLDSAEFGTERNFVNMEW